MTSIVPIDSADTLPTLAGPVGGDPVGRPQLGSAVATIASPVVFPASKSKSRRLIPRLRQLEHVMFGSFLIIFLTPTLICGTASSSQSGRDCAANDAVL